MSIPLVCHMYNLHVEDSLPAFRGWEVWMLKACRACRWLCVSVRLVYVILDLVKVEPIVVALL